MLDIYVYVPVSMYKLAYPEAYNYIASGTCTLITWKDRARGETPILAPHEKESS